MSTATVLFSRQPQTRPTTTTAKPIQISHYVLYGDVSSPVFHAIKSVLHQIKAKSMIDYEIIEMSPFGFLEWRQKQLVNGVYPNLYQTCALAIGPNEYQTARKFLTEVYDHFGIPPVTIEQFEDVAKEGFNQFLNLLDNPIVTMNVEIGGASIGDIYILLFKDKCPLTVQHFLNHVNGHSSIQDKIKSCNKYENVLVKRIVQDGWFEVDSDQRNNSSDEKPFQDENFIVKHDQVGILGMVNSGPNSNFAQFFVSLRPLPVMNKKSVAFGLCLNGHETLAAINSVQCRFEKPELDIKVSLRERFRE